MILYHIDNSIIGYTPEIQNPRYSHELYTLRRAIQCSIAIPILQLSCDTPLGQWQLKIFVDVVQCQIYALVR